MRYNTIAIAYIVAIILIAHVLAPGSYSWRDNTISELAAQRYNRAWIMRAGFIGFGALVAVGALLRYRAQRSLAYRDLPLLVYGLAMALAGVFSTRMWVLAVAYAPGEASLHSVLATLAGVALSLAALLCSLHDARAHRRRWHGVALALILALSLAFGVTAQGAGLVQRTLYLVGFAWLIYSERPPSAVTHDHQEAK